MKKPAAKCRAQDGFAGYMLRKAEKIVNKEIF